MIQIVKKKTPNSKIIKKLREAINLSQEEFLSRMKEDLGYTMSRRTYQRIEKGDDVQPKYLDFIIKFFDKQNLKLDIDDLVIEANKKKSAKAIKKSSDKKIIQTYDYQKTYLYNVNHFEDVSKLISKSSRRKFFYPLTPNSSPVNGAGFIMTSEKQGIEKIISIIDEYGKKQLNNRNQIARENYDNAKQEIDLLSIVTDFGEYIQFLNSQGIRLYASNFDLKQLSVEPVDSHPQNITYSYGVHTKTITIFCFKRDDKSDLNFNYENYWHEEKLNKILKDHSMDKFLIDVDENDKHDRIQEFEEQIEYFNGIDTSKVTFDHRVPFTNDEIDIYDGYEPDGRDLAELESQMEDEYKQQQREKEDDPF